MGIDDLLDGEAILLHQLENGARTVTGVDNDSFVRLFAPQNVAIFLKEANRKAFNDHTSEFLAGVPVQRLACAIHYLNMRVTLQVLA